MVGGFDVAEETWDGRLEDALVGSEARRSRAEELGLLRFALPIWTGGLLQSLVYLGRTHPLLDQLPDVWEMPLYRPLLTGDTESARGELRTRASSFDPWTDAFITRGVRLLECALLLKDEQVIALLIARLREIEMPASLGPWLGSVDRLLGDAYSVLDLHLQARTYYEKAMEYATKMRHRPELALSRLGLAENLLDHYPEERDAAIEHLDFAISELRDMKMQPALERALRHRGLLKA
jgi:hypothetical protein